jgi:hypothetical protein
MSAIKVMNDYREKKLCLLLEPWGADYWLAPGETFAIRPVPRELPGGIACTDVDLQFIHGEDCVQCYVNKGEAIVTQGYNEIELQCGHGRPEKSFLD